jgi:FMN phosphatase YigB (HAD superfamily)
VGDSYNTDIAGAKKAGMQTCWFNPKGASLSQKDVKPDFEIRVLYEILGILECV